MNAIAKPATRAVWPGCRNDMHRAARNLLRAGETDDGTARSLWRDFGAGLPETWPEEARMNLCRNVTAEEAFRIGSERASLLRQSDPALNPMSPGLIAFAEARGLVCAYCNQSGSRSTGPDGLSWQRDAVPSGFQVDGRDLELCCSVCKTDSARFALLGADVGSI